MERRNFLRNSAIGAGLIVVATPTFTFAVKKPFAKEYKKIVGKAKVEKNSSEVKLSAPEIAENGKVVPIKVEVPNKKASEVKSITVLSTKNGNSRVATATFSKGAGEAYLKTRMKLNGTQDIVAVLVLKNGKVYESRVNTKVTIGGCG